MKVSFKLFFLLLTGLFPALCFAAWSKAPAVFDNHRGQVTASTQLYQIHQGNYFRACNIYRDVADGANATFVIRTNSIHHVHFNFFVASEGNAIARLYEDATISDNGTERIPSNFNRSSDTTPDAKIFYNSVASGLGDFLCAQVIFAGTKNFKSGGSTGFTEWVLDEDTYYIINFTNEAGNASDLFIAVEWYETIINK